jgi:hypothetical protein
MMQINRLNGVPSANRAYGLLRRLGCELVPADMRVDIMDAARNADTLKKSKEFRIYRKMLNAVITMEQEISEADVPEVGPAYQSMRKLVDVFGEMEIG